MSVSSAWPLAAVVLFCAPAWADVPPPPEPAEAEVEAAEVEPAQVPAEPAPAEAAADGDEGAGMTVEEFVASLQFRAGEQSLRSGMASVSLSDEYRFLDADDSERLLVMGWGPPPARTRWG